MRPVGTHGRLDRTGSCQADMARFREGCPVKLGVPSKGDIGIVLGCRGV